MAYVDDIIAALGNNRNDASVRKQAAQDIVNVLQRNKRPVNNVEIVEDAYMPNGLMYTRFPEPQQAPQEAIAAEEDVLVPNRPNIDWSEPQGVSYAGGLGLDNIGASANNVSIPVANDIASALNREAMQGTSAGPEKEASINAFAGGSDLPENNTMSARVRSDKYSNALGLGLDVFNMITGKEGAYIGQTKDMLNKFDKSRMEEDPEGYSIDLNRAKVLSQKAIMEEDPAKKAMYGREIKKLLPKETQGLDDLTASEFFTAGTDSKLKLEQLKGLNKLQQIQLQNSGKMDLQQLKNASNEDIARLKTNTQWDIASLNNEYKKAIADNNNERALTVAQMITDRQKDLADINNAVKLKQTEMQQEGANYRTGLQQTGAMERVQAQQAGALQRTQLQQAGALERAKLSASAKAGATVTKDNWNSVKAQYDSTTNTLNQALDVLSKNDLFGPIRTRYLKYGGGTAEERQMLGAVRETLTSAVQEKLKQVRAAAGTGRAADTEKEAQRVLGYIGDDSISQDVIVGALKQFMYNADQAMKLKEQELFGTQAPAQKTTGASKIKSVKRIG